MFVFPSVETYHFSLPLQILNGLVWFHSWRKHLRFPVFFIYVISVFIFQLQDQNMNMVESFLQPQFSHQAIEEKLHAMKLGAFQQKGMVDCV
jgi:hypothetical protein